MWLFFFHQALRDWLLKATSHLSIILNISQNTILSTDNTKKQFYLKKICLQDTCEYCAIIVRALSFFYGLCCRDKLLGQIFNDADSDICPDYILGYSYNFSSWCFMVGLLFLVILTILNTKLNCLAQSYFHDKQHSNRKQNHKLKFWQDTQLYS